MKGVEEENFKRERNRKLGCLMVPTTVYSHQAQFMSEYFSFSSDLVMYHHDYRIIATGQCRMKNILFLYSIHKANSSTCILYKYMESMSTTRDAKSNLGVY